VTLNTKDAAIVEAGDRFYQMLQEVGIEVLYDDRDERAGVKFADADLIGVPLRLTVGGKSLAKGGVELKRRDSKDIEIVKEAEMVERLQSELQMMLDAILSTVVPVPLR